jgi:hypothetical protein
VSSFCLGRAIKAAALWTVLESTLLESWQHATFPDLTTRCAYARSYRGLMSRLTTGRPGDGMPWAAINFEAV